MIPLNAVGGRKAYHHQAGFLLDIKTKYDSPCMDCSNRMLERTKKIRALSIIENHVATRTQPNPEKQGKKEGKQGKFELMDSICLISFEYYYITRKN